MAFTTITPILRILDEAKAKEFYVDFLGFKVDWEHRAEGPLYMQISVGECRIHLSEHDGDARPGAAVKLHTDDIEAYVAEIAAKEYPPGIPPKWGRQPRRRHLESNRKRPAFVA